MLFCLLILRSYVHGTPEQQSGKADAGGPEEDGQPDPGGVVQQAEEHLTDCAGGDADHAQRRKDAAKDGLL